MDGKDDELCCCSVVTREIDVAHEALKQVASIHRRRGNVNQSLASRLLMDDLDRIEE